MDIPIDEGINSEDNNGWGDISFDTSNTEYNDLGAWNIEEKDEDNTPITKGDLYILLLETKEKPILCNVETINGSNETIELTSKNGRYFVSYDKNYNILLNTDEYNIIEIIKVKEFQLDDDSYQKEREDIDFETDIKEESEKTYSESILVDDLLSELIRLYECYDNLHKINDIQEIVSIFMNLLNEQEIEKKEKIYEWLIPVIDNDIKIYLDDGIETIKRSISILNGENGGNYINNNKEYIQLLELFQYKEGNGYVTDEYSGNIIRECSINQNCSGINGSYSYDERRIRKPFYITKIIESNKGSYNERVQLLPSQSINITGYLEELYNKSYYNNNLLFKEFSIYEKCLFEIKWKELQLDINKKRKMNIISHYSLIDSMKPSINENPISYNFTEKITNDTALEIIKNNSRNLTENVQLIINNEMIKGKIMNYLDIYKLLFKYNINYHEIDQKLKVKIDTLIQDNINEYIQENSAGGKQQKLKIRKKTLTNQKKSELSYEYIMNLLSINEKNRLLKEYIHKFTRRSNKVTENSNLLYDKYTDKPKLCIHHLYSVEINNSNNVFETMKTKFGSEPQNGNIFCKLCNELLCQEEYSILQGFSDDKPIQSYENITSTKDENEVNNIEEKLEKKKELVQLIDMFSTMIGVNLEDKDKYHILLSYDCIDHNNLADLRYKQYDILNIHPKIEKILSDYKNDVKKEKNEKKIAKLEKKKNKLISSFKEWIKNTNKLLIIITFVSLFIQTAVPVYNIRRDINFQIINIDDKKPNKHTIDFIISKTKELIKKYDKDIFFQSCLDVILDKDIETFDFQIKQCIEYCNNSIFSLLIERKNLYYKFIKSEKKKYLRSEWVNYKPLHNNSLNLKINTYLNKIENEKFLKKIYGGNLVENISIIRSNNNVENLSEILEIPTFKIINNTAFKKLLRYIISCYGIHKNNLLMNLLVKNLLETIDKKDEINEILKENQWDSSNNGFKILSFKKLREDFIPKVLGLYTEDNNEIESCFNKKNNCNKYIHISVNNYDLHQLNTFPKRIYEYIPSNIYPNMNFKEIDTDIIDKIFNKFKINSLNDIQEDISDSYLDKFLLNTALLGKEFEKIDDLKKLEKNEKNFQKILEYKRISKQLPYHSVIPTIQEYTKEDYESIQKISQSDSRFFKFLDIQYNLLSEEEKDNKNINEIIRNLPNPISDEGLEDSKLLLIHYNYLQQYLGKQSENKKVIQSRESFEQIFSEYINFYKRDIDIISEFISASDNITSDQKKRFEKIVNTNTDKKLKFTKENISIILNIFINSDLDYEDLIQYTNDLKNIITQINYDPTLLKEGTMMNDKIPKEWKLTDSATNNFKNFYSKEVGDEVVKSTLLLHNRIFSQPRNDYYIGFNYRNISNNCHIHLQNLYSYISEDFNNLELLKGDNQSHYNQKYSSYYCKYHYIKIIRKIVDYIEGLKMETGDIINDAMPLFRFLDGRMDELIEESIEICSRFLFDTITNLLMTHYDPTWLFMNKNIIDFNNRLSKQRESEKQKIVEKRHNASTDERYLMKLKKDIGQDKSFIDAAEAHINYVNSSDYGIQTEEERIERLREIYSNDEFTYEDIPENIIQNIVPDDQEGEGYIGEQELNEDGEEYLDDYDEEQEMEFNE